ncbi:hypothetical protein NB706_003593 [Xanthomonas sacchari]|nr:hypothetical protein [Xanthomonas sacchari]
MRLGQRAQHRQVGMAREQAGGRGFVGKLAIGFVHHQHRTSLQALGGAIDVGQRDRRTAGVARRTQEHQLGHLAQCGVHHRVHVGQQAFGGIAQRHLDHARVLQPRAHRVHAEHRRGDDDGVAARLAQGAQQQVDGLVAATAEQHLFRGAGVQLRQCGAQRRRLRVGIAAIAGVTIGSVGPGRLVGIEPDLALQRTAARGRIAGELAQVRADQRQHGACV